MCLMRLEVIGHVQPHFAAGTPGTRFAMKRNQRKTIQVKSGQWCTFLRYAN